MFKSAASRLGLAATLALAANGAFAAVYQLDTASATNGLYKVYSSTFDGALTPCSGGSPSYCSFFGGDAPTATGAIQFSPTFTGVTNAVPAGIAGTPPSGSFLDITVAGGTATLNGGTVTAPANTIIIGGTTSVGVNNAGFVVSTAGSGTIDGNGQVEILVNSNPALAADFSTLGAAVTSCVGGSPPVAGGGLCPLLGVLSLDMVRYRLFLDFNPVFSAFTGSFIGQTGNNSLVYATLNSTLVPVPAAVWLMGSAIGLLGWVRRRSLG
jgi:hypothetical protein